MKEQAARVKEALAALGLKHGSYRTGGDFTVRTDIERIRDKGTGTRYSQFGEASASLGNVAARELVTEHADEIARQKLTIIIVYNEGRLVTAIVSSKLNPLRTISILRDGVWSYRTASES